MSMQFLFGKGLLRAVVSLSSVAFGPVGEIAAGRRANVFNP